MVDMTLLLLPIALIAPATEALRLGMTSRAQGHSHAAAAIKDEHYQEKRSSDDKGSPGRPILG
jgi:hypothetical protein